MSKKLVALSFDDGPSNVTESILDILKKNNAVGTFFLIGENIKPEAASIIKREVNEGHEICNHSLTHSHMTTLSSDEIISEINKTTSLIKEYAGVEPKFFRPPFIDVNSTMYDVIDLPFICGHDSIDWDSNTSVEGRISNVKAGARDGVIVLMHDFTDNVKTVEALPSIIEFFKTEGYEFVTISKLFELKGINPEVKGKIWSYAE